MPLRWLRMAAAAASASRASMAVMIASCSAIVSSSSPDAELQVADPIHVCLDVRRWRSRRGRSLHPRRSQYGTARPPGGKHCGHSPHSPPFAERGSCDLASRPAIECLAGPTRHRDFDGLAHEAGFHHLSAEIRTTTVPLLGRISTSLDFAQRDERPRTADSDTTCVWRFPVREPHSGASSSRMMDSRQVPLDLWPRRFRGVDLRDSRFMSFAAVIR